MAGMDSDFTSPVDSRAACAWVTCSRPAVVRVEYRRAREGESGPAPPDGRWTRRGTVMALCDEHAATLKESLGAERIVSVTRLQ